MDMKWSYLIVGLLGFGLGVLFTYLILGVITPIFLQGISIATIAGIVLKGIDLIRQWIKNRNKERRDHYVTLAKSVRELAKAIRIRSQQPLENEFSHIPYITKVIEHLTSGYKKDWALWEKCQELVAEYDEEDDKLPQELEEKLSASIGDLKTLLPDYATQKRIARDIYHNMQFNRSPYQIKLVDADTYMIEFKDMAIKSPDIHKLKRLVKILNQLRVEQNIRERIDSKKMGWKQASKKFDKFKNRLNEIAEDVELGGKLEGKCYPLGY